MANTELTPTPQPTAILFGGGGAKGSFEVGAWKSLSEAGMLPHVTAAAGCSVGALNAVLFALGDADAAWRVWQGIQPGDLLVPGAKGAFFSREGLIRTIDRLPLARLKESRVRVYVSAVKVHTKQVSFFELNDLPTDAIRTLLLASSAIPHIYAPELYLGEAYSDGATAAEGELCISPVYAAGHRDFLLVTLRSAFSMYGGRSGGALRAATTNLTTLYPECRFTVVKPMRPLGNLLTGTLNFASEKIRRNYEQGRADAQTALSAVYSNPKSREAINAQLAERMKRLFTTGEQLAAFLRQFENRFAPNVQMPTLGGSVWYDNIFSVDGWRLQQQRATGLRAHYRFLTPENVRAAWILSPQVLLAALSEYEAAHPQTEGKA